MEKIINNCNGCADGCHGCGRDRTKATICNHCQEKITGKVYEVEDLDFCEDCIEGYLNAWYEDLTLGEKMQLFGWDIDEYATREGAEADADNYWYGLKLTDKLLFKEVKP